ncbi:hypothetical protein MKX01_039052 [Papaver californicum]|nr:hypothetical protein MKX01_039052 [Papaver californicum]
MASIQISGIIPASSIGLKSNTFRRSNKKNKIIRAAVNPRKPPPSPPGKGRKPPQINSINSVSEIRMTNMSESPAGREENGNHKAPQKDSHSNGLFITEQ